MLVKYYLSDYIKALFENFALGLRNTWAGPDYFFAITFLNFKL